MRTRRNRYLGLAGVALSATLLATACGSGTPGQSADEGNDNEGGDGPIVVDFWQQKFTDQEDAWYKEKIAEFNASQDEIEIKHQIVPGDAWDQKMKAAQAAGNAPDIYTLNYNKVPPFARLDQIKPLSDLIPAEKWEDLQDNIRDAVTVDGQEFAFPMLVEPSTVLYYRKDLFEAANLDPDAPPTTWAELIDYGQKLTTNGVFGFSIAQVAVELGWSSWGLQQNAAGQWPISDDWSHAQATNADYKPLLQFYQDLYSQGIMPQQALAPYPDAAPFGEGKIAMMANGSWAGSQLLNDFPDLVDNVGVAPMPSIDGDPAKPTATLGGWTLVVDGKSDQDQAAADFIAWLLAGDPEILVDYFATTKWSKFSPRTSVDEAIAAHPDSGENPWRQIIADEIVPQSPPEPTYDWGVSLAFGEAIEKALRGGDIDAALQEANDKIDKVIADLGLAEQLQ